MKKSILLVLAFSLLFCTGMGAAPKQTSISLSPFSSVSIAGPLEVSFVSGSDYRVLITLEEPYMDYLVCRVEGRILVMDLDERKVPADVRRQFRAKGTPNPVFSAVVYVPEPIQSVTLSGKSLLKDTEDVFDKARVNFDLSNNAAIQNLSLSSQAVKINMINKSTAEINVSCQVFEAVTSNTANLRVDEDSEHSNYSLLGSSKVFSRSKSKQLDINAKGNSEMTVSGSGDSATYVLGGTSEVNASAFEVPEAKVSMSSVCLLKQSAYKTLTVNLKGGSTLLFANEPQVIVENIKSSTMSRMSGGAGAAKL
jgi:hypothetical protein